MNYTNNPDALNEYNRIVDALYNIVETKSLSETELRVLIGSLKSRFKFVYESAGRRLVQLSHYFPEAGTALLELMKNPKAIIRVRVVQALWSDIPPKEITDEILALGARDRSKKVREFATDRREMIYG